MSLLKLSIPQKRCLVAVFLCAYLGAAAFYWPFGYVRGLSFLSYLSALCPACPNVDGLGSPLSKFFSRTFVVGSLSAALYVMILWSIFQIAQWHRQRSQSKAAASATTL